MRVVAAALLVLVLGQAVGLPALAEPCALASCAGDETGTCATPCAACLCCTPLRTLTPANIMMVASALMPSRLLAEGDTIPPDSPPHEVLHVPRA